tara:strand:- start:3542 stop:4105 length:564 start_codon:yes stop_codon:yes gene_type:complete
MLELGNQWMEIPGFGPDWAKAYYEKNGWDHTSADKNGEGGAVKVDLTQPGHFLESTFDIVTDHGTIEHINGVGAQYSVFKNLHEWGKPGCVYAHIVPLQNKEHQSINGFVFGMHGFYGYSSEFWKAFANECGYDLIYAGADYTNLSKTRVYSCACYVKTPDSTLLSLEKLKELYDKYVDYYNSGSQQ